MSLELEVSFLSRQ